MIVAMWVLCVYRAAVRLVSLLLIHRVLIVSNFSLVNIAFFAFVRLPLLVLCFLLLELLLCSSQNHTCLHDCFLPCFVDNIPLGCCVWCVITSLSLTVVCPIVVRARIAVGVGIAVIIMGVGASCPASFTEVRHFS